MSIIAGQITIADYAKWRPVFDKYKSLRDKAGLANVRVYRDADNPSELLVWSETSDVTKAREALNRQKFAPPLPNMAEKSLAGSCAEIAPIGRGKQERDYRSLPARNRPALWLKNRLVTAETKRRRLRQLPSIYWPSLPIADAIKCRRPNIKPKIDGCFIQVGLGRAGEVFEAIRGVKGLQNGPAEVGRLSVR
jgi:hypothetical protein